MFGEIDSRTPLAFSRLAEEVELIENLFLSSPGGNVYAAILVARDVDRLGLTTVISEDSECLSACSFIYFAGKERFADGELGIHQISSEDPDLVAAQLAVSDISELLDEFSVPNEVFLIMLRTPPDSMYVLTPSELSRLGLVGPRQALASPLENDATPETSLTEPPVAEEFTLAEGTYSGGFLTVVIDYPMVGITYTGQGCIGQLDAELQEQPGSISFVGEDCTIEVTKLGPFDFSLDQGPGCSYYHGAECSLSGYVRRSN